MIGNVWEWTDEWYARGSAAPTREGCSTVSGAACQSWPDATLYRGDGTWGIDNEVYPGDVNSTAFRIPSAAFRGGNWADGPRAGLFALYLFNGPSNWNSSVGFRCVVAR